MISRILCVPHDFILTLHSDRTLTPPQPNKSSYSSSLFLQTRISPPFDRARVMSRVNRQGSLVIKVGYLVALLISQEPEV